MGADKKLEGLKKALEKRKCTVEKHSSVMEITFEKAEDADWFQDIFDDYEKESAVSCLMSMRPKGQNVRHKFVFNITDMDKFVELLKAS
ncbi:MAG: hypothetical protein QM396_07445 [Euryarchaeota archaeon]|jgi:hypothetical protein|uniref:hypothetical protein n=1 Tax=Methanobacterium sp. MZD130B TaxID=3394378 RepID=UPI00176B7F89|nr:hypothetical protein [Euryarchaeota archaeon]HHT17992.1 hypothetical protein [Methanobacterium sp.]